MAAIQYQFPGDRPGISSFGIHIPDASKLGTGEFNTTFAPNAFASTEPFMSAIVNPRIFGISATVTPGLGLMVQLHDVDGQKPRHHLAFLLPDDMDAQATHILNVEFVNWRNSLGRD